MPHMGSDKNIWGSLPVYCARWRLFHYAQNRLLFRLFTL